MPIAPHVLRQFGASLLGRLPGGMVGLALVLLARDATGSYTVAGLAAAGFSVGLGLASPLQGRLVDRAGQTRPLLAAGTLAATTLVTLGWAAHALRPGAFVALAAVAGATVPPLPACMRALWPRLLGGEGEVQAAFALESTFQELVFIVGPLVVVGLVALASPAAAVAGAGVLALAGCVWFATAPASRAWRGSPRRTGWAGPLRSGQLRGLLAVLAMLATSFGIVEVTIPAFVEHAGARSAAGPVLAAWSVGSMAGGLALGGRSWRAGPGTRMALLLALVAAAFAAPVVARTPLELGALLFLAGAPIAPALGLAYLLVDRLAPPGTVTEAFTWVSTTFMIGIAGGNALGGTLAQHAGVHPGFLVAAALAAGAALGVARQRGRLDPVPAPPAPAAGLTRAETGGLPDADGSPPVVPRPPEPGPAAS